MCAHFPSLPIELESPETLPPICCFLSCKTQAVPNGTVTTQWMPITQHWRIISKQAFFCRAFSYCLVEILFSIPQYLFRPSFLSSHHWCLKQSTRSLSFILNWKKFYFVITQVSSWNTDQVGLLFVGFFCLFIQVLLFWFVFTSGARETLERNSNCCQFSPLIAPQWPRNSVFTLLESH